MCMCTFCKICSIISTTVLNEISSELKEKKYFARERKRTVLRTNENLPEQTRYIVGPIIWEHD